MAVISGWLGFLTGIRLQSSNYDPYAYGTAQRHSRHGRSAADTLLTGEKHRNRIVRRRAAAVRLRQVLFNLAGNGIKFTETGGVAVIVKPGEHESGIRFLVRDTGIGLKPEDQARVFRDFDARARGIAEFRSARTARRCRTDV